MMTTSSRTTLLAECLGASNGAEGIAGRGRLTVSRSRIVWNSGLDSAIEGRLLGMGRTNLTIHRSDITRIVISPQRGRFNIFRRWRWFLNVPRVHLDIALISGDSVHFVYWEDRQRLVRAFDAWRELLSVDIL